MCGIAGSIGRPEPDVVRGMIERLRHRGPDDRHFFDDAAVSFGTARLAILDLEHGRQPLSNEDGSVWVAQNGEIYNSPELREELRTLGHAFRTRSDTEVLAHAWEAWGPGFLPRLRGMFAIALWDRRDGTFLLARDRFGIKPLYVRADGDRIWFASELRAFRACPGFSAEIDPAALQFYLAQQGIPAPRTIYRGIEALEPAEARLFRVENPGAARELRRERYWDLRTSLAAPPGDFAFADAVAEAETRLEETVRSHLLSDVPIGAFLSGGIDSSLVTALASRASAGPLHTLTVGWEGEPDERAAARSVAERFGTRHEEIVLAPEAALASFDRFVAALDQPSFDGWNTFLVSEAAARHVKVALSGLGGDELFLGYPYARALLALDRVERILPRKVLRFPLPRRAADLLPLDLPERLARVGFAVFTPEARRALAEPAPVPAEDPVIGNLRARADGPTLTRRLIAHGLDVYLRAPLLPDADVMSMAHGLEVRVPYLDPAWAAFTFALPDSFKAPGGKRLLRALARKVLPREVLGPKRGFTLPIAAWLKGPLRARVEETLSEPSVRRRGFFRPAAVDGLVRSFYDGDGPYQPLWSLFVLESWARSL